MRPGLRERRQYIQKRERVSEMTEERQMKKVSDSAVEQSYLLMPRHINAGGRLFGGQLVAWIDEVAGIVGKRHSESDIVTACFDNLIFKAGAYLNDHPGTSDLCGKVFYGSPGGQLSGNTGRNQDSDQPGVCGDGSGR